MQRVRVAEGEDTMYGLGLTLASIFGGVFGMAIGFLFFVATTFLLALPYILLTRRQDFPEPPSRDEDRPALSSNHS